MAFDLFGTKEKQATLENEILQKMSRVQFLDNLIGQLFGDDLEEWITMGQSYYDERTRVVSVEPDSVSIEWASWDKERVQVGVYDDGTPKTEVRDCKKILGEIAYSFTKSGYLPLHAHYNEKGKEDVSVDRVCYLLASIIQERMAAKMPNCTFGTVSQCSGRAIFVYTVPALTFKDWF